MYSIIHQIHINTRNLKSQKSIEMPCHSKCWSCSEQIVSNVLSVLSFYNKSHTYITWGVTVFSVLIPLSKCLCLGGDKYKKKYYFLPHVCLFISRMNLGLHDSVRVIYNHMYILLYSACIQVFCFQFICMITGKKYTNLYLLCFLLLIDFFITRKTVFRI